MKKLTGMFILLTASAVTAFGQGTLIWDESLNGPLSQSSGAPTLLAPFALGTNTIIGMSEIVPSGPSWTVYPDFFTVQVPESLVITAVYLQVSELNVWHWIGDPVFLNELGFVQNPVSGELLAQWGLPSVGEGNYGMNVENHNAQPFTSIANYRLDFFVQAIPEPSAIGLFIFGFGILWLQRRKNRA